METPRCVFLFLFLFNVFLSATARPSAQPGDALIRATCKSTDNFALCVSTLESDPRSFKADVKGLAEITLGIVRSKANQTLYAIGDVFKNTMDPDLFRFLGTCIGDYDQTVSSTLPQAIKALETNNYGAAKQGVEDAGTSVQDCVDAIGGKLPEIIKPDKLVQDLILVAKSIISTLG
ncbi:cell wall / vacuolar inhibitor of fructosidase 1-like [Actinidia eriantha]|uniref:cell wall / vacuolar inhibitor of fructosidase 1-like n=1 Tax=Actinidia eriantha TaxID=165200 RepID=UPI00258D0B9C|nr:cell wall / vacuolar inhibitor of fructosidase 1-like [Actinidia eriantha]